MNHWSESANHYQQALKAGRKVQRQNMQQDQYPYLEVLDEILTPGASAGEQNLGLIEIPTDKIIGTKTLGRTNAFASNFMPLLPMESEFGAKWCKLCDAHLSDEGIRDPILCYEYLGKFYVQEGNKRVSVLKYFDASTIPGNVIRILPGENAAGDISVYQEFLAYYAQTRLYQVYFTRLGSFPKLQLALGYEPDHVWTDAQRRDFLSGYYYFETAFQKLSDESIRATAADALLEWLKIYSFDLLQTLQSADLNKSLETIWPDIRAIGQPDVIEVDTESDEPAEKTLFNLITSAILPPHLNIAFIHELTPETSIWTLSHEAGRAYLEETLGDSVTVQSFPGVGSGESAEEAMETAIANGAQVLFTTTPSLIADCRKIAAHHPDVKVFNCSVGMPYADVRTYYGRIYEGTFISGAIAAAISKSDDIGFIANYPIFGVPAGINAFALGAQLTNPNAKVHLRWSCTQSDPLSELQALGVDVISTMEIPMPGWNKGEWGTFRLLPDGSTEVIASPYWDWGTFYHHIARSILDGSWENGLSTGQDRRPVNYWWGMSSGVIDVEWTDAIPTGTRALAEMLKDGIVSGTIEPFSRAISDQSGLQRNDGEKVFAPEEILSMDWLCSNVEGRIPEYDELTEKSRALVQLLGIYRDSVPLQKESVLL